MIPFVPELHAFRFPGLGCRLGSPGYHPALQTQDP
ncbi:hypothetical protein SAMN04488121_11591, partial [Chitinophaga filiformis]